MYSSDRDMLELQYNKKHLYIHFTVFAVHFKLKFGYLTSIMLVMPISHMQWLGTLVTVGYI
jgi:hypothetical protein